MGFLDFVRNKGHSVTEASKGLVQVGKSKTTSSSSSSLMDSYEDDSVKKKKFEWYINAYKNYPLITAIIDVQTDQVVQEFWFEGPNKEKLKEFADKVNLTDFFHNVTKSMLIYGNAFVEIVKDREEISQIKILNSRWMYVYRKNTGEIIGYSQIIGDKKCILWGTTGDEGEDKKYAKIVRGAMGSIAHFKFNVIGSDKYGTSVIEPLLPSLRVKEDMENNLKKVVYKYVAPLIVAKVGNDQMPATQSVVDDIADKLSDLQAESELTVSHLVDVQVLDFNAKGMDIATPLKHIEQQIITGGQVPPSLLGRADGVDKATAEVSLRSFGRRIKSIQRALKNEFEDKILIAQDLATKEDKLVWTRAEEREWEIDVDIIRGLVTDGIITPQKANSLLPPKYEEELPDPVEKAAEMAAAMGQNQGPPGEDGPRPTQRKDKKVKDNPNDPTKSSKKSPTTRVNKTDRKVPVK